MRTTKPISTISFNSREYLALKLHELQKSGRISFWAFVEHQPEDDEAGKKVHNHVFVIPSKMLQTDDLREELKEYDPEHPDKPKAVLRGIRAVLSIGICTESTTNVILLQKVKAENILTLTMISLLPMMMTCLR